MPDICRHPNDNHTVWWWIEDTNDPILAPYSAHFDTRAEAYWWVSHSIEEGVHPSCRWIKIFRSNNEMYTCFVWRNPEPHPAPQPSLEIETKRTPIRIGEGEKRKRWWQLRR